MRCDIHSLNKYSISHLTEFVKALAAFLFLGAALVAAGSITQLWIIASRSDRSEYNKIYLLCGAAESAVLLPCDKIAIEFSYIDRLPAGILSG